MAADVVGEVFGPYRIEELLGRGGMGEVHRAYDTVHDRHVALKRLPGFAEAEFLARFRREARIVAALDEPHVVRIHDHGEIDGRLYLDMALVDGPDLKRVLGEGPLAPTRAVEILTQVAAALDAAHAAGVLHRDVKPANILLDGSGDAYLADFGIARPLAEDATLLTNTGDYVGTLDYMAPERLMRSDVDAASDVYSLACVLFQCLTGRVPFPAPDAVGKLAAQLGDPPPAPSLFDRRIPPAMDLVVRTGMDKDPRRRYPSAGELMAAAAATVADAPTAVAVSPPLAEPGGGDHFAGLLVSFVRDQHAAPTQAGTAPDRCPYPGLQSFGVRDSDWFFGREQAVRDLLARLSRQRPSDGPLIVVGASGAGKSSLLHAGLLAAQARAGERALAMTPGDRPIGTLAARLAALLRVDARRLAARLWDRPGDLGELCRTAAGDGAPLVLAVDQVEELFTLCRHPREPELFATALASAWPARVVVAVRADFVEHCITLPGLKPSLSAPYVLGPLTADELARVVTLPAEAAGLELEPGLVDRLVTDVGAGRDPGALPRLAHALRETWHNRSGNRLTLTGYQRTGGVDRAVALTADGVYDRLTEPDRAALRAALLRMVTLLDGGGIARRRAARGEVPARALESLVAARLVTVDSDAVSLSHDALLTAWPRLRQWVDEDRHGLLVRQQLGEAAAGWRAGGQDRGDLYRGARLAAALDWAAGRTDVSADEHAFLAASERDRRRTTRRLRGVVAGLATLLVLALAAGVVAFVARGEADRARTDAQSRQLAAESLAAADADPVGAMRDALEGWHRGHTVEARGALLSAPMLTYPTSFRSGLDKGYAIDVTADGGLVAVGSADGEVAVWDVEAHERLDLDISAARSVLAVEFSPDGTRLAVSSVDTSDTETGGITVWSIPDRERVARLADPDPALGSLSWRPDGGAIAALAFRADGTTGLGEWDPVTGTLIRVLPVGPGTISGVAYGLTGDRVAVGFSDGALELWDTTSASLVARHTDHTRTAVTADGMLLVLAFSSEHLASASVADNWIRLWDARTGALVREFRDVTRHATDPGQGPSSLAFNADGGVLYSNSDSNALTAWDTLTGSYSGYLAQGPGSRSPVGQTLLAIAVSSDGHRRVAVTGDGTVLSWHTNASRQLRPVGAVTALGLSPDHRTATAGDADGHLTTWDLATGRAVGEQATVDSAVMAVEYVSADVKVVGTVDGTITVMTTRDGVTRERTIELAGREFRGYLAVSPDGRLLAAAHHQPSRQTKPGEHRIGVWDLATLTLRTELDLGRDAPSELMFSPDGDRLAVLTNREGAGEQDTADLISWRAPDMTGETRVPLGPGTLVTAVFTPDGAELLTAGVDGVVRVRDARTGAVRREFAEHTSTVRQLAVSPDGTTLASITTEDSVVRLWRLADGEPLAVLAGHEGAPNEVVFSADGRTLLSGGTDTDVNVWRLDPADVVRRLCDNLADAGQESLGHLGC